MSPPGATLAELLADAHMTQAELAERLGRSRKVINEIIRGEAPLTPETALRLERVLGIPARFWNTREQHYREWKARQAERLHLENHENWQKRFPLAEMAKRGWIRRHRDPVAQIQELLTYFAVASPTAWETQWHELGVAFRAAAGDTSREVVATWLWRGEVLGREMALERYNESRFRDALRTARRLTSRSAEELLPALQELLAQAGVAVVVVPGLKGLRVHGATHWLHADAALIQLSGRYKSDDQFWFSFFHEAAHILLHPKKKLFLEGPDQPAGDDQERQADAFAGEWLMPSAAYQTIKYARHDAPTIQHFAASIGVSPGIVVGRLQHDGFLAHNVHQQLKQRYDWSFLEEATGAT